MARIAVKEGGVYTITNSRELKNVTSQILEKFGEVSLEKAVSISYTNGKVVLKEFENGATQEESKADEADE